MAKDDKEEKKEEPALEVITDETVAAASEKKDDGDEDGGDDDSEDDSSGPPGGDDRLGASDEEVAEDTKRADRKVERKTRRQKQRDKMEQRETENRFLREHNRRLETTAGDMAKRLDALEGTTIEGRIAQYNQAISKADDTIADAVTKNDGAAHKEASQIREQLVEGKRKLEGAREQQKTRREHSGNEVDPDIARLATAWASRNEWFDPSKGDEDSAIAAAVDFALSKDRRYDPRTPGYYKEFDRRLKARGIGKQARDSDADDADLDTDDPPRKDPPKKNGANGGPRFRGGGNDRQLGANQVYLSKQRLEAMEAAGIEPGTDQYKRMLKRYKEHDDAATNDTAR
jgi:hypothetical protein